MAIYSLCACARAHIFTCMFPAGFMLKGQKLQSKKETLLCIYSKSVYFNKYFV